MVFGKLEQFHHENLTWERSLEFFKQENSFLKTRLSQVLDYDGKDVDGFMALVEQFQNQFILKDELIAELLHDIHAQETKLKHSFIDPNNSDVLNKKLTRQQEKLRNEMIFFEKDFARLKNEFNNYLVQIL